MRRVACIAACLILESAVASAESPALGQREAIFKSFSKANKEAGNMLKGSKFDLAKVQATLKQYVSDGPRLKELFPDDSKGGEALPGIWKNKADFNSRFDKFIADAAAAAGAIKDDATFKSEYPKVAANCSGCHKHYKD